MAYDVGSRRTSLAAEVDGTDDFLNTYHYDNTGRLTRVDQEEQSGGTSVSEKRVDFSYNDLGQYSEIVRYADVAGTLDVATSVYTYDDASRLTGLDHKQGSTVLSDYDWEYDGNGRLTSVTTVDGTDDYTYDDTGQLTDVDSDYQTDESYTYDDNGNRTNTGYTTGTNNQVTSDGTYNYEYDDEGNRTKKTTISGGAYVEYDWDHRNRLTTVTFRTSGGTKTKEVAYTYDAFDRRIGKNVDADGDGTVDSGEIYAYDASQFQSGIGGPLVDPTRAFGWVDDIVLVFDESGNLVERLLHGPGVDQPLATEDSSGNILWLLSDHLGTIRDVAEYDSGTDTTTVVNHIQYSSFGTITSQTNSTYEPRFTFTGREWDRDAELFYYRARWYDAGVGRFISEDPLGFQGNDTTLSRYVDNGATNYIDPSGNISVSPQHDRVMLKAWLSVFGQNATVSSATGQILAVGTGVTNRPDWVTRYANQFNGLFGNAWSQSVGNGIYGGLTSSGLMSNASLANATANQLFVGTAAAAVATTLAGYAGGPALYSAMSGGATTTLGTTSSTAILTASVTSAVNTVMSARTMYVSAIGAANLAYRVPNTWTVRLGRFFATRTQYRQVYIHSQITRFLQQQFGWQVHHWYIANSVGRAATNPGVNRIAQAGWNLMPIPAFLNNAIGNGGRGFNTVKTVIATSPGWVGYLSYKAGDMLADLIFPDQAEE
ncbi:MAG: RHS repeat-associated core domain-containing protein [Fuerstiella sp.]